MNYPSFWQHVAISAGPWLLLLAGQAMPAHAVATYHAAAETTLKIVSIAHAGGGVGLFLEGEALGDITTHATGSAIADGDQSAEVVAADPFDMVPGDRIEQTASSTGNALLPDGAESDVTTNGDLHINNVSAYDVTVFLELSYSLQAEATASDLSEWGFAVATVDLFSGIDDLVDIFFDRVYSDTDDGGGQFTGSGTIPFDITVPAGKRDWVTAYVDAYGTTGWALGDVNLDAAVNGLDVAPFVAQVLDGSYRHEADVNRDGEVDGLDVDPFVAAVLSGGAQAIPEPATAALTLIGLGCLTVMLRGQRR
ncbi:MAG: hypothetical protein A2W31_07885 [Planctomycetes bacterium RBG_16_64_10]|nr:MAG: hypothetical protein A2W31_07885 [Planctomycetes bacterium RBG_16_64_10]